MLHFEFDGAATLFMKIFAEAGNRLDCRMESNIDNSGGSFGDGSSDNTSSEGSGSDDDPGAPTALH